MLGSLKRGGACSAARAAPIGNAELSGLSGFQSFASGVGAPKDAFGTDITQPGAPARLAKIIQGFNSGGGQAIRDIKVDPQVSEGLSKLAMLGASLGGK